VTVPDFEVRSSKIRSLSRALYLTLSPIVTVDQLRRWENYTAFHHQWINESLRVQDSDPSYSGPINWDYVVDNTIHNVSQTDTTDQSLGHNRTSLVGRTFYVPVWQTSPMIPHLDDAVYNWYAWL
jgi:hypothetical protein